MICIRKLTLSAATFAVAAAFTMSATIKDAAALDKITIGKVVATAITFTPLDIGVEAGIWEKNGIELDIKIFRGDAQNMQALTAGTVEMTLGSGPAIAFIQKGVPGKGVAAFARGPLNMVLIGDPKQNMMTLDDLKGKKAGVTTAGALTFWLVKETSARKGWSGADALTPLPLGTSRTQLAAMSRNEIQGRVSTLAQGIQHEAEGTGKVVLKFGEVLPDFITHIIYARNDMIASRPDVIRRFLVGWFETVDWMGKNRDKSVEIATRVVAGEKKSVDGAFDTILQMLQEADGTFPPAALKTLSRSFVDLKILDSVPDMSKLYTEEFLPKKKSM